jgi:hypothetical protein
MNPSGSSKDEKINHQVIQELKDADLLKMTPIEAMNLLYKLQNEAR